MKLITRRGLVAFVIIDILLLAAAVSVLRSRQVLAPQQELKEFSQGKMRITSPAFNDNETIPLVHTCDGRNVSPPLGFAKVPEEARSLALIVDDPDAPFGTFAHWVVWNIPASTTRFEQAAVPEGAVEGKMGAGKSGWSGPCPPFGTHRYFFKLYALDVVLGLDPSEGAAALEKAMEGHVIDKAGLVGVYEKGK